MIMLRLDVLAFAMLIASSTINAGFAFQRGTPFLVTRGCTSRLFSDSSSFNDNRPTYGASATPIKDLIDNEGAMKEFLESTTEWWPMFRSVAQSSSVPAMSMLGGTHGEEIRFDNKDSSTPWEELDEQPTDEQDRQVVAAFLDSMQQSLLDIPVDESIQEDDNDLHFLEEGRRMLALTRFQVLRNNAGGSLENFDSLFKTVWSELALLAQSGQDNTGSLILLPDYDLSDLRRFTDMNLLRPLQWLGMEDVFEIASLERDSPAIRLIHKLSDMPTDAYLEELEVEAAAQFAAEAEEEAKAQTDKENEDTKE